MEEGEEEPRSSRGVVVKRKESVIGRGGKVRKRRKILVCGDGDGDGEGETVQGQKVEEEEMEEDRQEDGEQIDLCGVIGEIIANCHFSHSLKLLQRFSQILVQLHTDSIRALPVFQKMVMSQRPSLPSSTHPTSPFQHPVSLQAFKSFIASPPPLFFLSCAVTGLWNTCIIAFLQKHYSRVIEASNTCQVFISELSSHSKYVERMSGVRLKILGVGVSLFSLFSKFLLKKEDGMDEGLFDEMQECLKALPSPCLSLAPHPLFGQHWDFRVTISLLHNCIIMIQQGRSCLRQGCPPSSFETTIEDKDMRESGDEIDQRREEKDWEEVSRHDEVLFFVVQRLVHYSRLYLRSRFGKRTTHLERLCLISLPPDEKQDPRTHCKNLLLFCAASLRWSLSDHIHHIQNKSSLQQTAQQTTQQTAAEGLLLCRLTSLLRTIGFSVFPYDSLSAIAIVQQAASFFRQINQTKSSHSTSICRMAMILAQTELNPIYVSFLDPRGGPWRKGVVLDEELPQKLDRWVDWCCMINRDGEDGTRSSNQSWVGKLLKSFVYMRYFRSRWESARLLLKNALKQSYESPCEDRSTSKWYESLSRSNCLQMERVNSLRWYAFLHLGLCEYLRGNVSGAVSALQSSLDVAEEDDPSAHLISLYNLSSVYALCKEDEASFVAKKTFVDLMDSTLWNSDCFCDLPSRIVHLRNTEEEQKRKITEATTSAPGVGRAQPDEIYFVSCCGRCQVNKLGIDCLIHFQVGVLESKVGKIGNSVISYDRFLDSLQRFESGHQLSFFDSTTPILPIPQVDQRQFVRCLSASLLLSGDWKRCVRFVEDALGFYDDYLLLIDMANALCKSHQDYGTALSKLDKALVLLLESEDDSSHFEVSSTSISSLSEKRRKLDLICCLGSPKRGPIAAQIMNNRAVLLVLLGKMKEGIDELHETLLWSRDHRVVLSFNLCHLYCRYGRMYEASHLWLRERGFDLQRTYEYYYRAFEITSDNVHFLLEEKMGEKKGSMTMLVGGGEDGEELRSLVHQRGGEEEGGDCRQYYYPRNFRMEGIQSGLVVDSIPLVSLLLFDSSMLQIWSLQLR